MLKVAKFGHLCKLLNVFKASSTKTIYINNFIIILKEGSVEIIEAKESLPEGLVKIQSYLETVYFIKDDVELNIKTNYEKVKIPNSVVEDLVSSVNKVLLPSWLLKQKLTLTYFPDQFNGYTDEGKPLYNKEVYFEYGRN